MDYLIENLNKINLSDDEMTDIGKENIVQTVDINELCEKSPYKKWIKLIDFTNAINYKVYNNNKDFSLVAKVLLDNDISNSGKKKRNTMIKFIPMITQEEYSENSEWLYIFTINDLIVKIGGTRVGIKKRIASYLCGHHIKERKKSGDCSKTNAYIYTTFEFYLNNGYKIDMYGFKLPKINMTVEILGESVPVLPQIYHGYESKYLENFKKNYMRYPALSFNADPSYKDID